MGADGETMPEREEEGRCDGEAACVDECAAKLVAQPRASRAVRAAVQLRDHGTVITERLRSFASEVVHKSREAGNTICSQ